METSLSGQRVARYLSQLIETRGRPQSIVCDNGTEFTCKAMYFWSQEQQVRLDFFQPGKPTQNAFVELQRQVPGHLSESALVTHNGKRAY